MVARARYPTRRSPNQQENTDTKIGRTRRGSRRWGMIRFSDFKLLSFIVPRRRRVMGQLKRAASPFRFHIPADLIPKLRGLRARQRDWSKLIDAEDVVHL